MEKINEVYRIICERIPMDMNGDTVCKGYFLLYDFNKDKIKLNHKEKTQLLELYDEDLYVDEFMPVCYGGIEIVDEHQVWGEFSLNPEYLDYNELMDGTIKVVTGLNRYDVLKGKKEISYGFYI